MPAHLVSAHYTEPPYRRYSQSSTLNTNPPHLLPSNPPNLPLKHIHKIAIPPRMPYGHHHLPFIIVRIRGYVLLGGWREPEGAEVGLPVRGGREGGGVVEGQVETDGEAGERAVVVFILHHRCLRGSRLRWAVGYLAEGGARITA